ncbi:MAG: transposase [Anaerolineae bacterium]|jgi:REP element-mobilizing transposase RayT
MANPTPLRRGCFYHIYNRGVNREDIFRQERNYPYFLQLYAKHVASVADTYAYCLLRNHFHFLVRIKHEEEVKGTSSLKKPSQHFSNLFNAYAKAFNRAHDRTGSLFQRPFGRIEVTSDSYFAWLVVYIHHNPQRHGFVDDFRDWPYSSYQAHLSTKPTQLRREVVLSWFDGSRGFTMAHEATVDTQLLAPLVSEDLG